MPGIRVINGPWPGGLNHSYADRSAYIADTELAEVINFNVDERGYLVGRLGTRYVTHADFATYGTYSITPVGSILDPDGNIYAILDLYGINTSRLYFSATGVSNTWAPMRNNVNAEIIRNGRFSKALRYNDRIWFVPGKSGGVGNANAVGFTTDRVSGAATAMTDVAAMPVGDDAFMLQDRMFIVDKSASTIYWSKATDPNVWASPDGGFFKVSPGDGESINAVVVVGTLVIIFKQTSTHLFTFTNDPAVNGFLRPASLTMGAYDAIVYQNQVYAVNSQGIFRFVNNGFINVSEKLRFSFYHPDSESVPKSIAFNIVGDFLIVGCWDVGTAYSMNLKTGAWTSHEYLVNLGPRSRGVIGRPASGGYTVIYVNDKIVSYTKIDEPDLKLDYDGLVVWSPNYWFLTKTFEFGDIDNWKRLYWWNVKGQFTLGSNDNPVISVGGVNNNLYASAGRKRKLGPSLRGQSFQLLFNKIRRNMAGIATIDHYIQAEAYEVALYINEKAVITQST